MRSVNEFLGPINNFLYVYILIIILLIVGIYFSVRTKFVQFRLLPDAFKSLTEKAKGKEISSFQSLMITTASRVGVGNIAGIATAIVIGGAGSIFWMWMMAFIGASSAFVESTLAQVYKVKDNGQFRGGPSYYIQKALGKRWLGIVFSVLLLICFAYGFNGLQSFNMSSAMEYYIPNYHHSIYPMIFGAILTIISGIIIFGGVHRIGFITSYIVPVMAFIYIAMGIFITFKNFSSLPAVFALIFKDAFDFKSMFGGIAGSALLYGIKRGLLSNEAGMGSAPNAAATADTSHPVKQGMVQVLSVLIDTVVICTTSAFIVLLSGVDIKSGLNGIPLVQKAVECQIGPLGIHIITFSIFAFAFTSIIGNYCYAESNILFIKNSKKLLNIFRVSCLLAVFLGTQIGFTTAWNFADILMALMAILNIVVIFLLGDIAIKCLKDYSSQKKSGKDPKFQPKKIGIKNADAWDEK